MKNDSSGEALFSDVVAEKDAVRREELIKKLVGRMTLDEKLFQMGGGARLKDLISYGSATFRAGGCKRLGIPALEFTDGPRGVVLNESTCFPVTMARGASWDAELEERVGAAIGQEARAQGANLTGAVCINLLRHPGWGRAQETYGEDTHHLGEMGSALTLGIQRHIMACVKHYAANSIENARFWVDAQADERTLREVYLPHFKKCIDAGAASVMGAYNRLNGTHCCHSRRLLTEILKEEWGFDGFVVSDWTFGLRSSDAADAGLDIEMPNGLFFGFPLKSRIKRGAVPVSLIDAAVARIIRQSARQAERGAGEDYGRARVACREHTDLALEAARKGIVLLKNSNGALPLARENIRSIAVIGELADTPNIGDNGSSDVHPPYVVTPLEGLRNRAGGAVSVTYESGKRLDRVKSAAREADAVVVVVGLTKDDEGEFIFTKGRDRTRLSLSPDHEQLIKAAASANSNCIVVLEGGSAITVENWIDDAAAVLMVWYPGMEGGNALADIIFGDVNPSGKLPITFARSKEQLPPFDRWARKQRYEYLAGYKRFDANRHEPRFAFGFGLSYTSYSYENLKIEPGRIDENGAARFSADITNTGKIAGEEIAQVYVGYPQSKVERPLRELKAFRRVALEPGERKTVTFEISARDLAYYDAASSKWVVEKAEYTVFAGASSREKDLFLQGSFEVS
ncbi:MAG: glycoside hydrolase family 3 C-terminal domain-containing protein [bacterium]